MNTLMIFGVTPRDKLMFAFSNLWYGLFIYAIVKHKKTTLFVLSLFESVGLFIFITVWPAIQDKLKEDLKADIAIPGWIMIATCLIFGVIPNALNYWQAVLIVKGEHLRNEPTMIVSEIESGSKRDQNLLTSPPSYEHSIIYHK